nr:uncharacterized protein LOC127349085 [Lolium perenne]
MEVDGESCKSWAWWLDALQAMRMTYSIPMDAKEARIRADVAEATLRLEAAEALRKGQLMRWIGRRRDPELLRVAAEEASRMDRLHDELTAVSRWAKTKDPKAAAYREQLDDKRTEMYLRTETEERQVKSEGRSDGDMEAREACEYRSKWKSLHSYYRGGSYDDTTAIPAMPYTDDISGANHRTVGLTGTLQIFSFKVTAIAEELRWPLDVYGLIAIRDYVDRRRNIIFARSRDNCQTITSQVCIVSAYSYFVVASKLY